MQVRPKLRARHPFWTSSTLCQPRSQTVAALARLRRLRRDLRGLSPPRWARPEGRRCVIQYRVMSRGCLAASRLARSHSQRSRGCWKRYGAVVVALRVVLWECTVPSKATLTRSSERGTGLLIGRRVPARGDRCSGACGDVCSGASGADAGSGGPHRAVDGRTQALGPMLCPQPGTHTADAARRGIHRGGSQGIRRWNACPSSSITNRSSRDCLRPK